MLLYWHPLGRYYEIKAKIDGQNILIKNFYMLPKSGRYKVKICDGLQTYDTEIENNLEENKFVLTDQYLAEKLNQADVLILWNQCVLNDRAVPMFEELLMV